MTAQCRVPAERAEAKADPDNHVSKIKSLEHITALNPLLTTGAADQSMIDAPKEGEVLNQNGEFQNSCGSLGAYSAWFFIKHCFGLPAFLIPVFLYFEIMFQYVNFLTDRCKHICFPWPYCITQKVYE